MWCWIGHRSVGISPAMKGPWVIVLIRCPGCFGELLSRSSSEDSPWSCRGDSPWSCRGDSPWSSRGDSPWSSREGRQGCVSSTIMADPAGGSYGWYTGCRTLSFMFNAPAYVTGSVRSIPESWDRLLRWRGVCEGHYCTDTVSPQGRETSKW